ncbi:MAG: response regulator [Rhodospirillales bacterium]|nr:response regulator [Alphaproteobacteria bacterium]MCB9986878.1 response regulator [Rhodospirillales bacterium]USO08344.1 MAG: response regulator [Rhodospirillales bacterium]
MSNTVSHSVLVVEDNDFVRMQIVRFLTDAGHRCLEASGADQGIEQMTESVDVIIADVRMEPADGFEFISALRARNFQQPVILVTGDQNPDILEKSSRFKVATILMKPVQKDRLLAMVARAIQMRQRST